MSDYISREAAIEKIRTAAGCAECDGNSGVLCICNYCDIYNAIRLIKSLPAADVEPVRHGRWENKKGGFFEFAACSLCGEEAPTAGITPNYCPNCGAKMDLEEETS